MEKEKDIWKRREIFDKKKGRKLKEEFGEDMVGKQASVKVEGRHESE